jgi:hypothetical protein
MIKIVEDFIIRKKLICYGGTAINNFSQNVISFTIKKEIPLRFFSSNALDDAKELADIYHKAGFKSIEAKSGCTSELSRSSLTIFPSPISHRSVLKYTRLFWTTPCLGIHYCPPDYLRMNMFWNSPPRWRHESMGEGVDEIIFAE